MWSDRHLLGLTLETAKDQIAGLGLTIQEYTRDPGEIFFPVDYQHSRINVRVEHGIIVEICGRG